MEDYKSYKCPKCQIIKHINVNEEFDFTCKSCGGQMQYIGVVRKNSTEPYKKENYYAPKPTCSHQQNLPHCPKCGSTSITTGARGINWFWGTIGSGKTVNRCANCGYTWKPNGR